MAHLAKETLTRARPAKPAKAKNLTLTLDYLAARTFRNLTMGYAKPKWILFCETMIKRGLEVRLYEAKMTASKYVTVSGPGAKPFKVRFSNHKPIAAREANGDCDFFVGVTHRDITTTSQAVRATLKHFGMET